jgi:hypothetical protein
MSRDDRRARAAAADAAAARHRPARPLFVLPLVILYVAFEVFVFAVVLLLARWVFDELPGRAVMVGNLLAATGMLHLFEKPGRPHSPPPAPGAAAAAGVGLRGRTP